MRYYDEVLTQSARNYAFTKDKKWEKRYRTIEPDTVKINLPKNDVSLTCDSEKIMMVFSNIITNALHAMNYNGTIDIGISDKGNEAEIEIQDTGIGIPKDVLSHIFEPLYTTKNGGTGLGLPYCKNIVEKHGGIIDVRTVLGKGTTFMIRLPKINA